MRHSFIDKYSELSSPIHKLNSQIKLIATIFFIVTVVLTSPYSLQRFLLYFILIFILLLISRVPILYVLKRSTVIIPFVLMVIIFIPFFRTEVRYGNSKYLIIWNVFIKSWLSALTLILLSSTTKFDILLKGIEKLYIPKIFILILSFMYRYIFVLIDEFERMERAWKSRSIKPTFMLKLKTFSNIIGNLFIRTYERSERVYQSMVSRGFDGEIRILRTDRVRFYDIIFIVLFISLVVAIRVV